ncbi:MAG: hypothetical protein HYU36_01555 [Planctomycetes bacterium]|nr:hypothetical protein [Planctomycetota bacterium]
MGAQPSSHRRITLEAVIDALWIGDSAKAVLLLKKMRFGYTYQRQFGCINVNGDP